MIALQELLHCPFLRSFSYITKLKQHGRMLELGSLKSPRRVVRLLWPWWSSAQVIYVLILQREMARTSSLSSPEGSPAKWSKLQSIQVVLWQQFVTTPPACLSLQAHGGPHSTPHTLTKAMAICLALANEVWEEMVCVSSWWKHLRAGAHSVFHCCSESWDLLWRQQRDKVVEPPSAWVPE